AVVPAAAVVAAAAIVTATAAVMTATATAVVAAGMSRRRTKGHGQNCRCYDSHALLHHRSVLSCGAQATSWPAKGHVCPGMRSAPPPNVSGRIYDVRTIRFFEFPCQNSVFVAPAHRP